MSRPACWSLARSAPGCPTAPGGIWLLSKDGFTSVSHIFVMEWAAVIRDVAAGLLVAGAVGAWVPDRAWRHLVAEQGRVSLGQPHLRDGVGGRDQGCRGRLADRWRGRRLGARQRLAAPVPGRASARGEALGTGDRPGHLTAELRLLDRQRAAGGRAVERRDQLRWRGRLHPGR